MTGFRIIRDRFKWYGLATGALFLIISTYMRVKFVFDSGNFAGALLMAAIILAILTLLFGLSSLPRWQSWIALAISSYAFYLLCFTRLYGID
jgi:cell division protein FtsW (lipid II flippase)